jgi:hypothetical protein
MVVINSFGGITPRTSPHLLPMGAATIAHDVRLRDGRIEPWHELCAFKELAKSNKTFHVHGCCAVGWDEIVTAAEVAPDWSRFFISGRTSYIEAVEDVCCTPQYYRLGVPRPTTPPSITGTEDCDRSADARAYVYTYVNKWGEESAPSPASNILRVDDGDTVKVTGIALPPDGYGIVQANIYRAVTAWREVNAKNQAPMTGYLYVATVDFPSTSFTDTVRLLGLGMALDTEDVDVPPETLQNVCSIDVTTRLAGTYKNKVYFSEPFRLWSWPRKYELTLDSNIVHMVQSGMKLFVTTDTTPYIIDCSKDPDTIQQVQDLQMPLPDIACVSDSSCIATVFGAFYSSPIGIILLTPTGKWLNVTSRWFGEREWADVAPETVRMEYWDSLLFIITDKVSFVLNIDGKNWNDMQGAELTTISDHPIDLHISNTGKLLMLIDGIVYSWDSSDKLRKFIWESGELTLGNAKSLWSPTTAKVRTKDTEFTIRTPLGTEYKRKVLSEIPFRIPKLGRHLWYKLRLSGFYDIDFVDVGTSNTTLNLQGARA